MNVNIWGPPAWDVLHACAFLFDEKNIDSWPHFFECLIVLLPCIHCRNSYIDFSQKLGKPVKGSSGLWLYKIHEMVNKKLFNQRLESLDCNKKAVEAALFVQPSFEVVRKRFIVNRDEPFVWRSLNTVLLAFAMGLEANSGDQDLKTYKTFLSSIISLINLKKESPQLFYELSKLLELKSISSVKLYVEELKYGKIIKENIIVSPTSNLITAGVCIKGSCQ